MTAGPAIVVCSAAVSAAASILMECSLHHMFQPDGKCRGPGDLTGDVCAWRGCAAVPY
jgi:hypothetical protein